MCFDFPSYRSLFPTSGVSYTVSVGNGNILIGCRTYHAIFGGDPCIAIHSSVDRACRITQLGLYGDVSIAWHGLRPNKVSSKEPCASICCQWDTCLLRSSRFVISDVAVKVSNSHFKSFKWGENKTGKQFNFERVPLSHE
jgi:hypothetical protein